MKYFQNGVWGRFVKFYLLAAVIAVVALCLFLAWSYNAKGEENMRRALAEARTLNTEIDAAWDYIDSVQPILTRMSGDPLFGRRVLRGGRERHRRALLQQFRIQHSIRKNQPSQC